MDTAYRPFVPRLVLEWEGRSAGARALTIEASLLGIDISGFTALSERLAERGKLGAEELVGLISRSYAGLIDIAELWGGDVLKFRGDALLMLFDGDGHEVRGAQAAVAMQSYIGANASAESSVGRVALGMTAGLVSGPCNFFLLGRHHEELLVCGPSASLTLALEDAAEPGEILVSARTADALEGLVLAERDGTFLLRRDAEVGEPPPRGDDTAETAALARFLPPPLRPAIEAGAIEAEHRHATAAFVKYTGSDALVEREDEATESLGALAEAVSTVTTELGVTWLESDIDHDGGKLYLVAGAPSSTGDEEERMLRALRQIVDARVGPPIAVGVHRGAVLSGPIGSPRRRTYAVMGDTVNLAARLSARAEKYEILATGDVLQRSRARFTTTSRQFLMKGKSKPVTGYTVGAPELVAADRPNIGLPLVGRDSELAALREAADAARLRQSRAVEIVGDAGAGKSRLVDELTSSLAGFQVLRAQCEPYAASTPFAPFRSILRPLVGLMPDEAPESAGLKLEAFTRSVMPDLSPWVPLLALAFDASVAPTPEVDEVEGAFRRDRLHDVLDQFLSRLLLMPTLLLIEDTHWLDDASQLLLQRLVQPGPRPWLIVLTRRPSGPSLVEPDGVRLDLEPLSADAARSLALAAAGSVSLSEDELDAVTKRAEGNPLFIRELAQAGELNDALPETIEMLLTARIDTLEPADKLLLRHAAVIGQVFDLDLLAEILPDEGGDAERWNRLSDFVSWDGPSSLRFRHDLVRTAAYDGLSFARRHEIHALVGSAIERRSPDPATAAEVLSLHFLVAGGHAKAWHYAVIAGDDARDKHANIDAATFYERALAAAGGFEPSTEELARVSEALGDVCELSARYEAADAAYARSLEHRADHARLLRKRGVVSERVGHYDQALELYELAAAGATAEETVGLQIGKAIVLYRQGHIDDSAHWAALAAEGAEALDDREALAEALYVWAAAEGDRGGPARAYLDRALSIFEELGLLHRQATVLNNMGVRAYYEGQWDEATSLYRRAEEAVHRAGDVLTGAHTINNRAEILLDQGHLTEAGELFERGLRTYRAAHFPIGEALVTVNLGRLAAAEGRWSDAHAHFDDATAQLGMLGSESFLIEADARRAEAFVLEGRYDDAYAAAARARDRMRALGEVGVRSALIERVLGLARLQGRQREEARSHLDESLRVARELAAQYEVARTFQARVAGGLETSGEAETSASIMMRLGVVWTPPFPLP